MFDFDSPPVPPATDSSTWGGIRNHRFRLADDDLRVLVHEDGRVGIYAPGQRITVEWLRGDTITLRLSGVAPTEDRSESVIAGDDVDVRLPDEEYGGEA